MRKRSVFQSYENGYCLGLPDTSSVAPGSMMMWLPEAFNFLCTLLPYEVSIDPKQLT